MLQLVTSYINCLMIYQLPDSNYGFVSVCAYEWLSVLIKAWEASDEDVGEVKEDKEE